MTTYKCKECGTTWKSDSKLQTSNEKHKPDCSSGRFSREFNKTKK